MTYEDLYNEVYSAMEDKPNHWRKGQFVFNYIDQKYRVARAVQFVDGVDCFYNDDAIEQFIMRSVEAINAVKYTEKDLISFGNYLLSKERDIENPEMKNVVGDWDIRNWQNIFKSNC